MKKPADEKASATWLQWQERDSVHPLDLLGCGCDEQQIFRRLPGSHRLRDDNHAGALMLLDEGREVMRHRPDVVADEDSVLIRGEDQDLSVG